MARVEIYTRIFCGFCTRAKQLLASKGVDFVEYDITMDASKRAEMLQRAPGRTTVPQIFIDDRHGRRQRRPLRARTGRPARSYADRRMKAALFQARTGIDPEANAAELVRRVAEAAAAGAAMLFTPEMSGLLDRDRARSGLHVRAEADDPVLAAVRAAARAHHIWVHLGSLALLSGNGGKLVNRGFVIDDMGEIRARYDKMHLFDVDLPTGESWRESASYQGGERPVLVDTPLGPLGLSICYDLRFAGLYAGLSDAGATIFSIPAAFTVPTGEAHWHVLMRARAIEAGAFVVAAAQVGRHEDGRQTYGHSLVVDPWGKVLLDMGGEEPGLGFADSTPARSTRCAAACRRSGIAARFPSPRASDDHLRPQMHAARPCFRSLVRLHRRL
jgi:predicted amidohydrolase/glutaredoxin